MQYLVLILAVALAGVGIDDYFARSKNDKLLTESATYKTQVQSLESTLAGQKAQIETNNQKIDNLTTLANDRENKAKQAVAAATISAQGNVKLADFILSQKQTMSDACTGDASNTLFNTYLDKRKENRENPNNINTK